MGQRGTRSTKNDHLTRKALALAMGCDLRTVAKWQDEGMPLAVKGCGGRPSLFSESAVRAWKEARDTAPMEADPRDARTRKDLAQAMEAEQRVAIKAKTLVLASDMVRQMSDDYARCRTKLLGLARKMKARRPQLSAADVKEFDLLVREALEDLARRA